MHDNASNNADLRKFFNLLFFVPQFSIFFKTGSSNNMYFVGLLLTLKKLVSAERLGSDFNIMLK